VARALPLIVNVSARTPLWVLVLTVFALTGCATMATRSGNLGSLPIGEQLVTLVVSEDTVVVRGECPLHFTRDVLGCQTSRSVELSDGQKVRVVKIVRYSDRAPSALAFEIDLHELCHAVATLQGIDDPCHTGNAGIAEHAAALPRHLLVR